jgi:hypothetical protein
MIDIVSKHHASLMNNMLKVISNLNIENRVKSIEIHEHIDRSTQHIINLILNDKLIDKDNHSGASFYYTLGKIIIHLNL